MAFRLQSRLPSLLVLFVHVLLTSHSLLSDDHESNLKISVSVFCDLNALMKCCCNSCNSSCVCTESTTVSSGLNCMSNFNLFIPTGVCSSVTEFLPMRTKPCIMKCILSMWKLGRVGCINEITYAARSTGTVLDRLNSALVNRLLADIYQVRALEPLALPLSVNLRESLTTTNSSFKKEKDKISK